MRGPGPPPLPRARWSCSAPNPSKRPRSANCPPASAGAGVNSPCGWRRGRNGCNRNGGFADPDWRSGTRDYWRVEAEGGDRLWLFLRPGGGGDRPVVLRGGVLLSGRPPEFSKLRTDFFDEIGAWTDPCGRGSSVGTIRHEVPQPDLGQPDPAHGADVGLATSIRILRADAAGLSKYLEEAAAENPQIILTKPQVQDWLPRWKSAFAGGDQPEPAAAGPSLVSHVIAMIEAQRFTPSEQRIALPGRGAGADGLDRPVASIHRGAVGHHGRGRWRTVLRSAGPWRIPRAFSRATLPNACGCRRRRPESWTGR